MTERIVSQSELFKGKFFTVYKRYIGVDDSSSYDFEVIHFNARCGVCAIPFIDDRNVLLINHFHPALGTYGWKLPTGKLDYGVDPEEQMQLELQEEIGFRAGTLKLLARSNLLPDYIGNEASYIFLARDLKESVASRDEPYKVSLRKFAFDSLLSMIAAGEISDMRTAYALLFYHQFHRLLTD